MSTSVGDCYRLLPPSTSLYLLQLQGCFSSDSNVCKHEIPQKILRQAYVDRNSTSVFSSYLADAQLDNQLG